MAVMDVGRRRGAAVWVAGAVAAAALLGSGGTARADEAGMRFVYEREPGAERCPEAAQVRARIAELAGEDMFVDDGADVVSCVLSSDGDGLSAEIELRRANDVEGSRRVVHSAAGDCDELAESASVIIAMVLVRSSAGAAEQPVLLEQVDDSEPLVRRPPRPPPEPDRPPRPASNVPFAVATAGALVHTSADVGLTIGVGGGVRWGRNSLEVDLQLETEDRTPGATEGYVTSDAGALLLLGCRHAGPLSGCGMASLGWIQGQGHDLMGASASITPHFRVGARVAAQVTLGDHVEARAYLDLLGSLSRTALYIDDERVWESPMGSAALGIATALRFP